MRHGQANFTTRSPEEHWGIQQLRAPNRRDRVERKSSLTRRSVAICEEWLIGRPARIDRRPPIVRVKDSMEVEAAGPG